MRRRVVDTSKRKLHYSNSHCKNRKTSTSVDESLTAIKNELGDGIGLGKGKFKAFGGQKEIGILYVTSLCDTEFISNQVITPLLRGRINDEIEDDDISKLVESSFVSSVNTKIVSQKNKL
ncbi:hypothetical protein [Clostridium hydrogenum]|uniref:hypothetical protein n=1 Tax=Clostridium hydrogenum TaxID=2855764 RepID=UPI001F2BECA3|nr:hypothetical protein [Clostridium hydrogenum]